MARISGVDIPREKRLEIALTYIFGIGKPTSQKICVDSGLDPNTRVRSLTEDEVNRIRIEVEKLTVEGDLRQQGLKRKLMVVMTGTNVAVAEALLLSQNAGLLVRARVVEGQPVVQVEQGKFPLSV